MRNILLWAGIAILAFQDYFKQQPVKPTRRQQFLQTGETSQAFVEGIYGKNQVYFNTQGDALDYAFEDTERKYEIIFPDRLWSEHIPYETNKRYTFELLTKNGNMSKKVLVINLYRMYSGRYELNYYIG